MRKRILGPTRGVRLRAVGVDEYVKVCTPFYRDEEVLRFSEGGADPYDSEKVRRMFEVIADKGEVYLIEIRSGSKWIPIGDASLLADATPIAIGDEAFRSRGIGGAVLSLLVDRASALGWNKMSVDGVALENKRALRMYRAAGFHKTGEKFEDRDGRRYVSMEKRLRKATEDSAAEKTS